LTLKDHLRLLGFEVVDLKPRDGLWADTKQLEVVCERSVIPVPDFVDPPGAQPLPAPPTSSAR
jgi:hypothetical protein